MRDSAFARRVEADRAAFKRRTRRRAGHQSATLRLKTLVLVAVMTATAISFVGVIGFIGLVAPHVARILWAKTNVSSCPARCWRVRRFIGGERVLSKVIIPGALFPVGIVTSFVGVPFFFWIVLTKR